MVGFLVEKIIRYGQTEKITIGYFLFYSPFWCTLPIVLCWYHYGISPILHSLWILYLSMKLFVIEIKKKTIQICWMFYLSTKLSLNRNKSGIFLKAAEECFVERYGICPLNRLSLKFAPLLNLYGRLYILLRI